MSQSLLQKKGLLPFLSKYGGKTQNTPEKEKNTREKSKFWGKIEKTEEKVKIQGKMQNTPEKVKNQRESAEWPNG